jgi:hypothetical protein
VSLETLILQTVIGGVVVVVVAAILMRKRATLRAQGDSVDVRALAAVENRVRILGVAAIFFAIWSFYRFTA